MEGLAKSKGFFIMDDVQTIENMALPDAKAHALTCIHRVPGAKPINKARVRAIIEKANTVQALMQSITNHILAHPSEGLKVL